MSSDAAAGAATPALRVRGLTKRYRLGRAAEPADTLVEAVAGVLRAPVASFRRLRRLDRVAAGEADAVTALDDVSFDVAPGEVVGIVGANGAGKSTLLKILSRITEPSAGHADLAGRVASLLEVGTGFHPELTGRENVYLNGTLLGMTRREVDDRFRSIVAFSDLAPFLDTPVKRYSSGMRVRLAFSVAAHLEPEILLVDEVLAVGDAAFQKRCLGKMEEAVGGGRTVLFVSHQMGAIRELCPRSLWLDRGWLRFDGDSDEAIRRYLATAGGGSRRVSFAAPVQGKAAQGEAVQGETAPVKAGHAVGADAGTSSDASAADGTAPPIRFVEAAVVAPGRGADEPLDRGDALEIHLVYRVTRPLRGVNLSLLVRRGGSPLFASFDVDRSPELLEERRPGLYRAHVPLPTGLFKAGRYSVTFDAGRPGYQVLAKAPGELTFDLGELGRDVSDKSWAAKRAGEIALDLDWHLDRAPDRAPGETGEAEESGEPEQEPEQEPEREDLR